MKIVTIVGARPQFIKAGTISREIKILQHSAINVEEIIVHTGQHYDANMSDVFFDEMSIPKPDYFLGVGGSSHGAMTGQMVEKIEQVLMHEKPDWVLVYGDTNSTLAGALAASKLHIKIAHVEAGLRSFNTKMPEEINRILTDRVSELLFCPTQKALDNLRCEGVEHWGTKVYLVGDVMKDGALYYKQKAQKLHIEGLNGDYVLSTIHRAENTDNLDRLRSITSAISDIANELPVVLPLHPRTRKILTDNQIEFHPNVHIIEPVGYLNMVWLINNCNLVLTDSGGLQKEAFFFEKPCITMRDETEWMELVEQKNNYLVGADQVEIVKSFQLAMKNKMTFEQTLYGDGCASSEIIKIMIENT